MPEKHGHLRRKLARIAAGLLVMAALPAGAATVTAQLVVDREDIETSFELDMAGNLVSLFPADIVTDDSATAGNYAMALHLPPGFHLDAIACNRRTDGSTFPATVTLGAGGVVLDPGVDGVDGVVDCVFSVQVRLATVVASIETDRSDVEQEFVLDMGGELVRLLPGAFATDNDAPADFYAMTLAAVPGYRLMDVACTRRSDGSRLPANLTLENGGITFAPGMGRTVDCLFSLEVQQASVVASVRVDSAEPVEQSFSLDQAGRLVTLYPGDQATDAQATPDFYAMTLAPQPGYQLMEIVCVRRADNYRLPATVDLALGAVTLAPGTGATIDCEFLLRPTVAVVSATITTDSATPVETEFTLEMNGEPVFMLPDELATDSNARADLYRMALMPERSFRLADVACIRESDGERLTTEINPDNQSVAFAPGIGNRVHCTFHLNALQAAVTARVLTNRQGIDTEFEIQMNGEPHSLRQGEEARDEGSRPDLYRIALLPNRDFRLMDIACLRDGNRLPATINASNHSIAFAPGVGGNVDCTFSLQALRAQVTATARLGAGLPRRPVRFDMNGEEVTVQSDEAATDGNANALLYRIALIPESGMQVTDITCNRAGERLNTITDLNNQSVGFSPGAGGSVDCLFTVAGAPASTDPFDLMAEAGITPDETNSSLTFDADGRPRITLGVPGAGAASAGERGQQMPAPPAAADSACCSCNDLGGPFVAASSLTGPSQMPCDFDIPDDWVVQWGNDGLMVSVVAMPACSYSCTSRSPALSLSVGLSPNSNAEVQEEIWAQIMPVVGSGSCGEGRVVFYQPPGGVPGQAMGSVRFHLTLDGERYGGVAGFSCGGPPDWGPLQDLFIRSFRTNPGADFP